jgi:hypothetical protein
MEREPDEYLLDMQDPESGAEDRDRDATLRAAGAWADRDDDGAAYVERFRSGSRWDNADGSDTLSGDTIGPFYDEDGLARLLGVKPFELAALQEQKLVLSVHTSARTLFPAWQFGARGELLPELPAVRVVLDPVLPNDLTVARWLHTPTPRFDGRTAADLLRSGETATVIAAAMDDAHRLAQ